MKYIYYILENAFVFSAMAICTIAFLMAVINLILGIMNKGKYNEFVVYYAMKLMVIVLLLPLTLVVIYVFQSIAIGIEATMNNMSGK